jgi:TonB family protein
MQSVVRLLLVTLALGAGARSNAQVGLFVEDAGKPQLVRKVEGTTLLFQRDGRWVKADRKARTALRQLAEFLPYVVTLDKVEATSHTAGIQYHDGSIGQLGVELTFSARLTSPYALENVFLLLEIEAPEGTRTVQRGIGDVVPGREYTIMVTVPTVRILGGRPYVIHLFSDGIELLHTQQPEGFRAAQLDRIVARRIDGVKEQAVRPLVGPDPLYPTALAKAGEVGEAVVRLRVTRRGAAQDVELVSATRPEFGPPALAAAREWRFLPAVKDGMPQESWVELPFRFEPPKPQRR